MILPGFRVREPDVEGFRKRANVLSAEDLDRINFDSREQTFKMGLRASIFALGLVAAVAPAHADRIRHPTAVFAGLDKITGRIIAFDVAVDETVQFGSLQITPRACFTRPQTEAPLTLGFVEVDEVGASNTELKRIFSGWMFAASPGLHGVEHPVYDAWITDCKGGKDIIPTSPENAALNTEDPPTAPPVLPKPGTVPRPRTPPRQAAPPSGPAGEPAQLGNPVEVGPAPGNRAPNAQQPGQRQAQPRPQQLPSRDDRPVPPGNIQSPPQQRRAAPPPEEPNIFQRLFR